MRDIESMRAQPMIMIAAGVVALVAAVGLGAPPASAGPAPTFEVVVRDFYGAEGYTYVYDLRPDRLVVTLENDFGRPAKELCTALLSADQVREWVRFFTDFPLESLAPEYVNPAVDDGQQLTFSVRRGEAPPRVIQLANEFQADLAVLCDRVAALVPAKCVPRPLKLVAGR